MHLLSRASATTEKHVTERAQRRGRGSRRGQMNAGRRNGFRGPALCRKEQGNEAKYGPRWHVKDYVNLYNVWAPHYLCRLVNVRIVQIVKNRHFRLLQEGTDPLVPVSWQHVRAQWRRVSARAVATCFRACSGNVSLGACGSHSSPCFTLPDPASHFLTLVHTLSHSGSHSLTLVHTPSPWFTLPHPGSHSLTLVHTLSP